MKGYNLILDKQSDVVKAIALVKEKAKIYEKKIDMYEKRKAFRREYNTFELNRRAFYRKNSKEEKIEVKATAEEIKCFWESMWNKKETTDNTYDRYLKGFTPGTVYLIPSQVMKNSSTC